MYTKVCPRGHEYQPIDERNKRGCLLCARARRTRYEVRNRGLRGAFRRLVMRKPGRVVVSGWGISKKPGPCRSCGARAAHLHHAIPRSKSRAARSDLRNGLPLCFRCHQRWHEGYPIRREVFTEEEWEFISSVELVGERIEEWLNTRYPSVASIRANALVVA